MNINISRMSKVPLYEQIIDEIKRNIVTEELSEMEQLPSIRKLAKELEVSVITVKKAYETLEQQGYLITIPSQGTYVANLDSDKLSKKMRIQIDELLDEIINKAQVIDLPLNELIHIIKNKMKE